MMTQLSGQRSGLYHTFNRADSLAAQKKIKRSHDILEFSYVTTCCDIAKSWLKNVQHQ